MSNKKSIDSSVYRPLYGEPADYVVEAHAPFLDASCQQFIQACTFMVLSSTNQDGFIDMSPRGGEPGFIHILDEQHIALLDEPGNKKLHTISNLAERGKVGMLFMVPGVKEVLRAYGVATAIADEQTIIKMGGRASRNKSYIRIQIKKIFPHCSTALNKAKLWSPEKWPSELAEKIPNIRGLGSSISSARKLAESADKNPKENS